MSMRTPLREPSYFVLAALLDGPLHGYAVIKRVDELSAGRVRLAAGTLYAALDRLAAEELLTVYYCAFDRTTPTTSFVSPDIDHLLR